jgi:hypothetical protein
LIWYWISRIIGLRGIRLNEMYCITSQNIGDPVYFTH